MSQTIRQNFSFSKRLLQRFRKYIRERMKVSTGIASSLRKKDGLLTVDDEKKAETLN